MDTSGTTNESCSLMVAKDQIDSPSFDEDTCGVSSLGRKPLKKGPWTSAEDAILTQYVQKHGEGNWNAVQKNTGLSRCGKSCRLRWANHLKPYLKKGAFTAEEEKLIIELHARMGNKWARMAGYLPGRTDNEIKNYWNTRIKRCLRAGLPLYPPNMCFQVSNENRHCRNAVGFNSRNKRHNELSQGSSYNFPNIIFKTNQAAVSYASPFPDISMSTMLSQGIGSPNIAFTNPTGSSQTFYPGFHDSVAPKFENVSDTVGRILGLDFPYVPDPGRRNLAPFGGAVSGSHALINGIFSASKSLNGAEKSELPSLQYPEADLCSWIPPQDEVVDMFIQSPPATVSMQSDSASAQNSGLLDALLHGAKKMNGSSNQPSEMSSNSSSLTPSDTIEWSSLNLHVKDWDANSDPISPLGCSAISVFSEFTPPISGSSSDELTDKPPSGTDCGRIPRLPDLSRPDALLGADWLVQGSEIGRDHSILNDAIATLLGDDFYGEYKHSSPGTPSSSGHASELLSME